VATVSHEYHQWQRGSARRDRALRLFSCIPRNAERSPVTADRYGDILERTAAQNNAIVVSRIDIRESDIGRNVISESFHVGIPARFEIVHHRFQDFLPWCADVYLNPRFSEKCAISFRTG